MQNNRGFTFMELMIVIAIMGLLAGFAIPRILSYRSNISLRTNANEIVDILQKAKSRAIKDNDIVTVTFFSNSYKITSTNLNKRYKTSKGITLTNTLAGNDTEFSSKGWLDDAGIVTVQGATDNIQISLSRLGRISIN